MVTTIRHAGYVVSYDPTASEHRPFSVSCNGRTLVTRARFAEAYSALVAGGVHWSTARAVLDDVRRVLSPKDAGGHE